MKRLENVLRKQEHRLRRLVHNESAPDAKEDLDSSDGDYTGYTRRNNSRSLLAGRGRSQGVLSLYSGRNDLSECQSGHITEKHPALRSWSRNSNAQKDFPGIDSTLKGLVGPARTHCSSPRVRIVGQAQVEPKSKSTTNLTKLINLPAPDDSFKGTRSPLHDDTSQCTCHVLDDH